MSMKFVPKTKQFNIKSIQQYDKNTCITYLSRKYYVAYTRRAPMLIICNIPCCLIAGLTWTFGYLAIEEGRLAFAYIFTILNSLQGFFIFLMFTLRQKKVRQYWKKLCCKCMRTKEQEKKYRSIRPTSKGTNDNQINTNSESEITKSTFASFDNKTYVNNKI